MPLTIVATPGAADANSLVTEAHMVAYCEGRLNAFAFDANNAQHLPALVEASRDMSLLPWLGVRSSNTQRQAWPRMEVPNPDASTPAPLDVFSTVVYYADDIIPDRVIDATCELANQYLLAGTTDLAVASSDAAITRKKVGPLETEWDIAKRPVGIARFTRVWQLVGPLLQPSNAGSLQLLRS